jgi:diguanylate cyclase (GGDEF)-like protein
MPMIVIESNKLLKALNGNDLALSLGDIIDLYAQIVMDQNDIIDDKTLQKLLCKETKSYCDADSEVKNSSNIICGAKRTTENIITAVKANDNEALNKGFLELNEYQKRIEELEKTLHTDELTHFLNRRYLFSEQLKDVKILPEDGVLFVFYINYFKEINLKYGYDIGDKILKFCAKSISSMIDINKYKIIRFSGSTFVIIANEDQTMVVERKLSGFKSTLNNRPIKISNDESLKLDFLYGYGSYKTGEEFDAVLSKVVNKIESSH